MRVINRLFTIATLAILFCTMGMAQSSNFTTPTQDNDGYYRLSTQEDLAWFAEKTAEEAGVSARLTNDITLTFTEGYKGKRHFSTNPAFPFAGTFDGNNYTIHLDNVDDPDETNYTALFVYAGNATIKNLRMDGAIVAHSPYCASFVGLATGFVKIENCISDVYLNSNYGGEGTSKVYAGFIAKVSNGGRHFEIDHSAYRGHTIEQVASDSGKFCGLVGESEAAKSGNGRILDSFVYCESVGILTSNFTLYPIGDVTDNSEYLNVSKFYVLQPGVSASHVATYNNLDVKFASADGFAGKLESNEVEVITPEYVLWTVMDSYSEDDPIWDLVETRKSGRKIIENTYDKVGGEYVFNENDEGEYAKLLNVDKDYNVSAFLSDEVWSQGSKYPELIVPETYVTGGTLWSKATWSGNTPDANTVVRIKKGQDIGVAFGASVINARDIIIEDGASLTLSYEANCKTNSLTVEAGGTCIVEGSVTLNVANVNVDNAGTFKLRYTLDGDMPSLVYDGTFTGNATIEREFFPRMMTHVGSSVKSHSYSKFSSWAFASYFTPDNGWTEAEYIDERDGSGVFAGDITTARVIGISAAKDYEEDYKMTEVGVPSSVLDSYSVNAQSKTPGYITANNPYPYTVSVLDWKYGNTVAWKELEDNGEDATYKVYTFNVKGGVVKNGGTNTTVAASVAPFKTVTYQVGSSESVVLPSTIASAAKTSKSVTITDNIRLQLSVGGSTFVSDEGILVYMNYGSMTPDLVNLDSKATQLVEKGIDGVSSQVSSQLFVRKPNSNVELDVAIVPQMADVLGVQIPFDVVLADGVTSFKIHVDRAFLYEDYYTFFIYDAFEDKLVNVTEGDFEVSEVGVLADSRFSIICVEKGKTPVVEKVEIPTDLEEVVADENNIIVTSNDGKVIVNNVPDELVGTSIDVYNTLGVKVSSTPAEINNTLDAQGKGVRAVVINGSAKKVLVK